MPPASSRPAAVCVAPVLRPDLRNYTRALCEAGVLRELVGGAIYHRRSLEGAVIRLADRALGTDMGRRTEARRVEEEVPPDAVVSHPWPELLGRVARQFRICYDDALRFTDRTFAELDRFAATRIRDTDRLVVAQEDCCFHAFRAARLVGATSLYDLPIAYHTVLRNVLAVEEGLFPGVSTQGALDQTFSPDRMARKAAEATAADHILVPSLFVRDSLSGARIPPERITTIPFGCDPGRGFRPFSDRKPLVLFVGQLSLRKGVPRLLRVWSRLGAYRTHTLRLIGRQYLDSCFLSDYTGTFEHVKHVPRSELWKHYSEAKLFVFPSAGEGFALVQNEAMSCGLPVIASSNTGIRGFISEGIHGLTYQHGDDDALASHLDWALSHPREVAEMGRAAYDLAQRWGWPEYRAEVRKLVAKLMDPHSGSGKVG